MVVGNICSRPSYKWHGLPGESVSKRKPMDNQIHLPGAFL